MTQINKCLEKVLLRPLSYIGKNFKIVQMTWLQQRQRERERQSGLFSAKLGMLDPCKNGMGV